CRAAARDRAAGGRRARALPGARVPLRDRVQPVDGGLVRARRARARGGRRRRRKENRLMFDPLARFIYKRRRFIGVGAAVFFVLAIAVGGSVARHLAPYGNDDPATESVRADDLIQSKGYRETSVVVLFKGARVSSPAMRARVRNVERQLRSRHDVATVTGHYDSGSRAFVSRNGHETYLSVALRPTDDKKLQDAANAISDNLDGKPGITVGGNAVAQQQVNSQTESDLRRAELLAFPILFLLS